MKKETNLGDIVKLLAKNEGAAKGKSTAQIMKETGKSLRSARQFIREAMDAGLCELAGHVQQTGIDGKTYNTPVYRFSIRGFKR